jgi:hypothetical protein
MAVVTNHAIDSKSIAADGEEYSADPPQKGKVAAVFAHHGRRKIKG